MASSLSEIGTEAELVARGRFAVTAAHAVVTDRVGLVTPESACGRRRSGPYMPDAPPKVDVDTSVPLAGKSPYKLETPGPTAIPATGINSPQATRFVLELRHKPLDGNAFERIGKSIA